jgi:uncharacterized cysteine cluster protein YcgN (CxxCxxCC family)
MGSPEGSTAIRTKGVTPMPRSQDYRRRVEEESQDVPLTANTVIKWTGIAFTLISGLVSLVWFAALLKGDIITMQQETVSMKHEIELRDANQDKEIDKLKDRSDSIEKNMSDMGRKLDVAITLLERVDKRVGNP